MNLKNRTIFTSDNLPILRGINSDCIDLIYLDPPFNSNRNYAAPIGTPAEGAEFKDIWTLDDVKNEEHGEIADKNPALYQAISAAELTHSKSMKAYLIMMAVRLTEMHRILKPTGSLYLHCDPNADSYLRLLLDAIFGQKQYRNQIVWAYTGPGSPNMRQFNRKHDVIFFYSKDKQWIFNKDDVRLPYKDGQPHSGGFKGGKRDIEDTHYRQTGKIPETWWNDIGIVARSSKERTGYPTQKPLKLLRRIISASSNPNDIVLDPFCGCATTCIAAQNLNRQWIGIDISPKAVELVKMRMERDLGLFITGDLAPIHRTDIPKRTDIEQLPHYRTHKHELYGKQEGVCNGCNIHFLFPNLDVDHITPQSKGGLDHISNLQLLCTACNRLKGTGTMAELKIKLQ